MTDIQRKLLKAHVALALSKELGRRPTDAELTLHLRVLEGACAALRATREQPKHERHQEPHEEPHQAVGSQQTRGGRIC